MRHLRLPLLLLLTLWIGLGAACSKRKSGSPADGQVVGGVYTNSYFRFTVHIPSGWSVGELKPPNPPPAGSPAIGRNDAENAHQLLLLSEKPIGTPAATNASLLIMAEKTATVPGVKSAKDYLVRISQLMADASIVYRPIHGITNVTLGGAAAVRLDFSARLDPKKTAHQSYVISQRDDHLLSFILSGPSETEIRRVEQVLQTVQFH